MLAPAQGQGPEDLRLDQPVHRAEVAAVRRGRARTGYLVQHAGRRRLAVGPVAGRHGAGRLHQPRRRAPGSRQAARPARPWASTASRPTSASASRPTSSGTTAPTRSGCTTTTRTSTTRPSSSCWRRSAARARPCSSPARRPPAASSSRCTGAATAGPPSRRWPRRCAAASRCRLSGFGFWSHDIGGFEGTPDPAVFKRWVAFGLLSSHSRLHGIVVVPRAVGVRRGSGRRGPAVHPPQAPPDAVPVRRGRRGAPHRRPDDARRWCWSSRTTRPARTLDRQYMLGAGPAGRAGLHRRRRGRVLRARGHLDPPADRRARSPGPRWRARDPRLRQPAAAGPPGRGPAAGRRRVPPGRRVARRPRTPRVRPRRNGSTSPAR